MFNVLYISYNPQEGLIEKHLNIWKEIPLEFRKNINFILIDDGSNVPINPNVDFPVNLTIARINEDIFCNTSGAKNLGFTLADDDWVFSCEIDHFVEPEEYIRMINYNKKLGEVYRLSRYLNNTLINLAQNIFIIHKEDFWKSGGYDEDLAGNHGYDDLFIIGNYKDASSPSIFANIGLKFIQTDIKICTIIKYATGSPEHRQRMEDTKTINLNKVHAKQQELIKSTYKHGGVLRFTWGIIKEIRI